MVGISPEVESPNAEPEPRPLGKWVGVALIAAAALEIPGQFVPFWQEHDLQTHRVFSISLSDGWASSTPVVLGAALLAAVGLVAFTVPRHRLIAAIVVGYCASSLALVTSAAGQVWDHIPSLHPAAGFYLMLVSAALEAGALIAACVALFNRRVARHNASVGVRPLAILTAAIVAVSTLMNPVRFRFAHESLWRYALLPGSDRFVVVAALVAVGLVPLVAPRMRADQAVALTLALAVDLGLGVAYSALARRDVGGILQVAPGLWVRAIAVVLIVVLAVVLRSEPKPALEPPPAFAPTGA